MKLQGSHIKWMSCKMCVDVVADVVEGRKIEIDQADVGTLGIYLENGHFSRWAAKSASAVTSKPLKPPCAPNVVRATDSDSFMLSHRLSARKGLPSTIIHHSRDKYNHTEHMIREMVV